MDNELNQLYELRAAIESEIFQKMVCQPLRKEQESLRLKFFSDSLKDSWKKGGKYQGIEEFFKSLKHINTRIKDLQLEDSDS
jgi:hypothetical protein